jgi:hypothetical protein
MMASIFAPFSRVSVISIIGVRVDRLANARRAIRQYSGLPNAGGLHHVYRRAT